MYNVLVFTINTHNGTEKSLHIFCISCTLFSFTLLCTNLYEHISTFTNLEDATPHNAHDIFLLHVSVAHVCLYKHAHCPFICAYISILTVSIHYSVNTQNELHDLRSFMSYDCHTYIWTLGKKHYQSTYNVVITFIKYFYNNNRNNKVETSFEKMYIN